MIKKVLIANRGEIAVRIIRACREMGIETVAVYSEADKEALHTQLADEAICIGPAPSSESYLNMEQIISATIVSGADAIHPGFGFLSENTKFAELCEKCNIIFIGPDSKVISRLGNKSEARNTMANAGVPIIPGSREAIYDAEKGKEVADLHSVLSQIKQFLQKKKLTVNVNGKNYDVVGEIGLSHTAIDITGSDVKIGDVASVEISPLMVNPNIPRIFE